MAYKPSCPRDTCAAATPQTAAGSEDRGQKIATENRVLTACPSCLQGLARYSGLANGLKADYLLIELARHTLGENWMKEYVEKANNGGIERVLL